ncbi:MAG TPA: methylated-DNA--[protein]-cysteine S-methyltransferase [Polyangiaceae bacterium]|nr:methylated-DNA--[protein]-cysteine S-methyltransferase [Polyangiaceae bacterium]
MNARPRIFVDQVDTPLGRLALLADEDARLLAAGWTDGHARMERQLAGRSVADGGELVPRRGARALRDAILAYFAGEPRAVDDLPVAARGTAFQLAVWRALRDIPYGETRSYGEIARRVGRPTAVRAVGAAAGANPIAIVVPCHRVVGADGALTGYAAGLDRKRWLLAAERESTRARRHPRRG